MDPQILEKLNEIAKKYDALPIYAGLKETLDKVRLDPIAYDQLVANLRKDSSYSDLKADLKNAPPCDSIDDCDDCPVTHLCTIVYHLYCDPTPKTQKRCYSFVITTYPDGLRRRPWFWVKDSSGWCKIDSKDLWMGTYEDAIKIAETIEGVSVMTLECAKEIMSHYEEYEGRFKSKSTSRSCINEPSQKYSY